MGLGKSGEHGSQRDFRRLIERSGCEKERGPEEPRKDGGDA